MSRVFGLMLVGWIAIGMSGCVGPMGAGCCGTPGGPGFCDSSGCGDASCGGCDSCTGCGELYIDPWINHPADCVDPCDVCGNHNGQSCGKCRSVFSGMRSLWGYRCGCDPGPIATSNRFFAPGCSSGCDGCDSCMVEPACGCEGACGCGVVVEPGCGLEPTCGCEGACNCGGFVEPGCGFEPACGCEGGCSCGGGVQMDSYGPPSGSYIIEDNGHAPLPPNATSYKPSRTRKIFNPRTDTASRGFLNEYRR